MILFIRLGMIRDRLMFNGQQAFRAVDCAVAVVVVVHRAVKLVITEDSVEGLSLRLECLRRSCRHRHSIQNVYSAGTHKLAISLHQTGVARLDRSKLRVVTHLGKLGANTIEQINQSLVTSCVVDAVVNRHLHHAVSSWIFA